ncbi:ribonuclease H-like protein, partial [Gymnopus androsaceus JB14]
CHHYQLVFTDGSGINNGRKDGAVVTAGIGAAIGTNIKDQDWRVIDDTVDPGFPRTNQRAELLGALFGLGLLYRRSNYAASTLVVATDSEYIVKGMTEWYPTWKARNWRTAKGTIPTNIDLFHRLNARVTEIENAGIVVGFWHVPREMNMLVDELSRKAARSG